MCKFHQIFTTLRTSLALTICESQEYVNLIRLLTNISLTANCQILLQWYCSYAIVIDQTKQFVSFDNNRIWGEDLALVKYI